MNRPPSTLLPVSPLPTQPNHGMPDAVFYTVVAAILLIPHFMLNPIIGPASYAWLVFVAVAALGSRLNFALVLLMLSLFCQNVYVAVVAPYLDTPSQFSVLEGTNFVVTVIMSMIGIPVWLNIRSQVSARDRHALNGIFFFFCVIMAYTALGAVYTTAASAIIYARVYLFGIMLLIIGIAFGFRIKMEFVMQVIYIMSLILVTWGLAEFCFTRFMYELFNIPAFLNLKYISDPDSAPSTIREAMDHTSHSYLNLSGQFQLDFQVVRPYGPNMHSISYAYALAFCCLLSFIYRAHFLSFLCFIFIVLVGAKGPMLITVLSLLLYMFYALTGNRRWLLSILVVFLVCYAVSGLIYGQYSGDYHVIGFLGGVNGFLSNPVGHGIGVGGNLSAMAIKETDFDEFQRTGATFALESAMGVMLYQLGIATAVFLIFYYRLWRSVWLATGLVAASRPRLIIAPIVLALLVVNSIFQEEALSPVGWGLWLLFCGFIMAQHWQEEFNAKQKPKG
jgi:hypothetical protein